MDNRSIFSKTGKGSLEISKKTIKLSSEERQALILVDGKTAYGELQEKLSRVQPVKLRAVFEKLVDLELIREFVAKNDPPAAPLPVGAISVRELDGGSDLDFTALMPAASAPVVNDVEARRRAAAEVEEESRKVREEILRKEQGRKLAEEAARHAAEEASRQEAAAHRAAEEESRRKADSERLAREQREREEAARRAAEAESHRKAEAEQLAREQREREEKERREHEETARRVAEEESRRKTEAERVAREQREREERERLERERLEQERRAQEEAARLAEEEESRRKAEAERLAREQREREERERLKREQEEKERREREAAVRRAAEEEAQRKAEAERLAREQRERDERERIEHERAEKELRDRKETEKREREEAAHRVAEEENRRKAEVEARRKTDAEQHAREERELEARHREEREKLEQQRLARAREETEHAEHAEQDAAARPAATTTAAAESARAPAAAASASLDFNADAKSAVDADLDFAPAASEQKRKAEVDQLLSSAGALPIDGATPFTEGGPDTFADTGSTIDPFAEGEVNSSKVQEAASRKEIEREAKERVKAEARAKKEAEREAKRRAKESHVKIRRGGPSMGVMIAGLVVVVLVGAVGYLFVMPIDKAAIERTLSERLGEPVTIGSAKFSPFPPELTLNSVTFGSVKASSVVAHPDSASLISDHKIWKSVDVNGLSLNAESLRSMMALGLREVSKIAASRTEIQRVRINETEIAGLPIGVLKFKADVLLNTSGTLKQVTLATPDDKARVVLQPDEKGWLVDIESKAMTWPVGPKIAWESVRAKGIGTAAGIKFEDYSITHFGGTSRGAGELGWNSGWKFNGNLDAGSLESESVALAFYGAAPVSGTIEGKLSISMSGASLARMLEAPQMDGALSVNKAIVKSVDLARTAQTGAAATGSTRFSDFSATLAVANGKLQLKDIKGVSGLLTVSGVAEAGPEKNLGGSLTVELGVGGSRAKAIVKLSGTVAEPKFSK